jgi:hypothetical protein
MAVALVQEADAASSSVTLGTNATAGNTLVVAVACLASSSAAGVTGITLGGSADNFALVTPGPSAQDATSPNDYINVSVWADENCAGGSAAIAVTGTGVMAAWAWEFSGLSATAENWQVIPVPTYQDSWVTGLPATTVPVEAWFAVTCAANQAAAETLAPVSGNGWTAETAYSGTAGSYDWGAQAAYQVLNTTGTPAWSGAFSEPSFSVTVLLALEGTGFGSAAAPPAPAAGNVAGNAVITSAVEVLSTVNATGTVSQATAPALLTPTAVKKGNYTARPGDFVIADASHGNLTITMPGGAPDRSMVGARLVNAAPPTGGGGGSSGPPDTTYVTVQAAGSDTFDTEPPGTTTAVLSVVGNSFIAQYKAAAARWYVQSSGFQLPGPPALNSPQPADAGYAAWACDPLILGGTFTGTALAAAGNLYLIRCPVRAPAPFSGIRTWLTAAGTGLTSGQNFAGVYDWTGAKLGGTGDQTSNWGGPGLTDASLTIAAGTLLTPPYVWAAFLFNGTTGPSLALTGNHSATWANGQLSSNAARFGMVSGPYASLPASFSPASVAATAPQYWAALY